MKHETSDSRSAKRPTQVDNIHEEEEGGEEEDEDYVAIEPVSESEDAKQQSRL